MRRETLDARKMGMRRETLDARKLDARRETIAESHASRLSPRRVSGLTSRAPWTIARLGEATVMKRGKYITRNSVRPGNVPVILGGQEPAYYCDEANHAGPCIVISRSGASAGFVSYWDQPIFVTDGFLFEANEKSNIRYLYYCLKANQSLLGHMQNGTGIPHVRGEELKAFEIPLPPLPIQQRIADILSAYDDLIENNRRRIAILEETARLAYRKWLKENNNSLKSTRIGDLIELQSGFAFKSNTFVAKGKYKIITIKNVKDVVVDGENVSYVDDVPERMPQHCYIHSGDILLSLTGNVGRVSVSIDEDGLLNQRVAKVKSDFHWFSLLFLTSTDVFCRMNNLAVGAAQQNLSPVKFCNEMFELPEHSEMALINELVEPLFEQIVSVARFSSKLAAARDMLLPRLMKGDVVL